MKITKAVGALALLMTTAGVIPPLHRTPRFT